ncbi:16460_t:CDS:1 [Racocetra fulgida]|uniref:16460_t:CDS:1 n=1 Tax=Racocetra fulgida TaxID=60492 RepID=A0A9N8Z2V5_9GLOM|nr:16460_t:CDS:1 [Racocetra fulgida]
MSFNCQISMVQSSNFQVSFMPSDTRIFIVPSSNNQDLIMMDPNNQNLIMMPSNIVSTSTIDQLTLLFFLHNSAYYVGYIDRHIEFEIPSVDDALTIGKGKKIPPTCFILFRKSMQSCVTSLGLRIPRDKLSKHIQKIWNDQKKKNPKLVERFKVIATSAAKRFYASNFRLKIHSPVRSIGASGQSVNSEHSEDPALACLLKDLFPAI